MMVMHAKSESLSVPSPVKGHRHRRSAAISLDWRNIQLPPMLDAPALLSTSAPIQIQAPGPAAAATEIPAMRSPSLHSSSSVSECSLGDAVDEVRPVFSTQVSASCMSSRKRVSFLEEVQEIPASQEEGDTWLKPEDYTWPLAPSRPSAVNTDPLAPSIDLAPAAVPTHIPGSPVLLHKKRNSFLQTTKNVLSRRPSKSGSKKQRMLIRDTPLPVPQVPFIDLDAALGPAPSLRHKRSGSLGSLPPSPHKAPSKGLGLSWTSSASLQLQRQQQSAHKRADSAPADMLFSFTPRPLTPDSRKRKMSSIVEHPSSAGTSPTQASTAAAGVIEVRMDYQFPSKPSESSFVLMGEPGDIVDSRTSTQSNDHATPATVALSKAAAPPKSASSSSLSPPPKKKGWKGYLHRLLH